MTQYNTLNVKFSNSQIHKLKSGIKNGTDVTLKISSKIVGGSNDENNFPEKLLSTNAQVSYLCKTFENNSSGKIRYSQLHKIAQSGGFLGRNLGLLLKNELSLIENVLKPLVKSVLSVETNVAIHEKMFGSGNTVTQH